MYETGYQPRDQVLVLEHQSQSPTSRPEKDFRISSPTTPCVRVSTLTQGCDEEVDPQEESLVEFGGLRTKGWHVEYLILYPGVLSPKSSLLHITPKFEPEISVRRTKNLGKPYSGN